MAGLSRLIAGLRALFGQRRADADLDDEVRAYLQAAIDRHVAAGMSEREAARAARLEVGSAAAVKDYTRDVGWETWIERGWLDVRLAVRATGRNPGFTLVAVLTLALGIGANAAMFAVADAALFKPLPYAHPNELVEFEQVFRRGTAEQTRQRGITWRDLDKWKEEHQIFAGFETCAGPRTAVVDDQQVDVSYVSAGLIPLLGVAPRLGRAFVADDVRTEAPVALLAERYWKTAFGSRADVINRTIVVDGLTRTIVGVMPSSLSWNVGGSRVAVWLPLDERKEREAWPFVGSIARLRSGLTLTQAEREVDAAAPRLIGDPRYQDVDLISIDTRADGTSSSALSGLLAAVGVVLLVACANVANLVLGRTLSRQRELAVRTALGATRARLTWQLTIEGLVLVLLSTAVALLIASWTVDLVPTLIPRSLGLFEANPLAFDRRTFAVCLAAALLTVLVCGLLPAIRATGPDLVRAFGNGGRVAGVSRSGRRIRSGLQTAQVALTIVLLVGASLAGTSVFRMAAKAAGYDVSGLMTASVSFPESRRNDAPATIDALLARVNAVPGWRAALGRPPTDAFHARLVPEGQENAALTNGPLLDLFAIDTGYVNLVGIPLKGGRAFTSDDKSSDAPVALIDERAAAVYWPGRSPIGQRFRTAPTTTWVTVVGIVGSVKTRFFSEPRGTIQVYVPLAQQRFGNWQGLVVRGPDGGAALRATMSAIVRDVDPALRLESTERVADMYGPAFVEPRFRLFLFSMLAGLALITASIGLFGVLTYAVNERVPEIGIRLALGGTPAQVRRLVIGEALGPVATGVLIGVSAALLVWRAVAPPLYATTAQDPVAVVVAVASLLTAAGLAVLVPVRRATQVDPLTVLRAE